MSTKGRFTSSTLRHSALLAAMLLVAPLTALAQDGRASTGSPETDRLDMSGMDHSSMQGMEHGAMSGTDTASMPGMDHKKASTKPDAMQGVDHHGGMPGMDHGAMSGMTMGPMQGGGAPPNARSPDYSDGIGYGSMQGMEMLDNAPYGMLSIDQLEAFRGRGANGQAWEIEGWYGNDLDKLWLRTEGERSSGKVEDADLEVLWNRNVATFWGTQLGVRHDFGEGPSRTWAAFGVQGLAPYWFELEATGYVAASGRTAARLRAEYELLLTQRLILQPEAEINLYGRNDPARRIGNGVSDLQFGLRLRYEVNRQFAPYIGVNWVRRVGTTADYARDDRQPVLDRQIVAGVRLWF
ncbi:copper resistance protein B [Dokdonella soli]|uniref:Copper resistance protein B n=1 Tax=Dokdonella soli TaxID=529810 RepID=A0ABN1IS75_9GAMM